MIENNKDKVKIVSKNYPLRNHRFARKAAAAALAAGSMGKFWEFHEALYKNMDKLNDEKIREIATTLGLDPDELEKRMNSRAVQSKITRDIQDGEKAKIRGTPTVFINGKQLKNLTVEGFQEAVDAQLEKLK